MEAEISLNCLWFWSVGILVLFAVRVVYLLFFCVGKSHSHVPKDKSLRTLIILGSGGHTAEMLNLVALLSKSRYYPRSYVAAATDNMSLARAETAEKSGGTMEFEGARGQGPNYLKIFRSREVGQSYITSIGTTLVAMIHACWLICRIMPDVILCNGPGTCIPLCIAGFFLKVIGVKKVTIFYIESIARVKRFSLSGLLLYKLHLADRVYVQWPQLKQKYPNAEYVGRLM